MAQQEQKNNGNKLERVAEIGNLVLGAALTMLQIYFVVRQNKPQRA